MINTTTQSLTVRPLDALARDINYAHGSILEAASSMLKWARRAGEFLIEAKKQCPHGTFKAWVEANTKVKYATAAEYMRVARVAKDKNLDLQTFDGGIRAFLDATRERTTKPTTPNLPTFTQDDAEYALKIAARIDSDFEGEREVAKAKLERFAKGLGMTGEELVEKAKAALPNYGLTETEKELNALREELSRRDRILIDLKARFASATKDELIEIIAEWQATGKLRDF